MLKKVFLRNQLSILIALLCSFAFCFYISIVSFFSNQNFFSFGFKSLINALTIPFVLVFVVVFLIFYLTNKLIFFKKNKNVKSIKDTVSPLHIVACFVVLSVWLEGFILNIGLPELTGEDNLFNSLPRLLLDTFVWGLLIIVAVKYYRKIAKYIVPIFLALVIFLALGIADAYISREEKISVKATSTEVLDRLKFNDEDNVLVLVLDSMSTGIMKDYFDDSPSCKDELEGFVMFENNIQSASYTQWSIPSILRGGYYDGKEDVLSYQGNSFAAKGSLADIYKDKGYNVYCTSFLATFNELIEGNEVFVSNQNDTITIPFKLYGQLFLRFSPYAFKNLIANNVGFSSGVIEQSLEDGNIKKAKASDIKTYDEKFAAVSQYAISKKESMVPAFHFHHINGMHKPYIFDRNGNRLDPADAYKTYHGLIEQTYWTMNTVANMFADMKKAEIYDDTTIVLLGDHDDRLNIASRNYFDYSKYAALLIKPKGSKEKFRISDAPTSNSYLAKMLPEIHNSGKNIDEITKKYYGVERKTYIPLDNIMHVYEGDSIPELQISSYPLAQKLIPTVMLPNIEYSLIYTIDIENVAVEAEVWGAKAQGLGIRSTEGNFGFKYLVDEKLRGQRVNVIMNIRHSSVDDTPSGYGENDITIKDAISEIKDTFKIDGSFRTVELSDIKVSDTDEPYIEFECEMKDFEKKQLAAYITKMLIKTVE